MATVKEYLDYAELAQASYGLDYIMGSYLDKNGKNILIDPKNNVNFSTTQAKNFADRYTVLATSAQYEGVGDFSSFDAVLFLDTQTGKKVMAIRGSQEVMDFALDAALDEIKGSELNF